ncbi:glycosyltransferase family 1 protein [Trinickia symbiotica]|uniref:Glycosyltransferase family 1 protein n=1 Tax=Trinickia symbiotica TaxID=863227 RepID=A0A2T3XLS0_9BURK|nr:glycosyltransferase [Trinickia symbiotica]PTB17476.1 glycosyltransferase family 1 protein [Trinickia symbiotica]
MGDLPRPFLPLQHGRRPQSSTGIARRGNIYFNYNLLSGCNYHRIVVPLVNMPADFDAKVPVLFFNRLGIESHVIDQFQAQGARVVIDLDDDIALPEGHVLHEMFKRNRCSERLIENIRRADIVTVTNSHLASKVKQYHKNIVVVPNALPFDQGQFAETSPGLGRKIIYAGGFTHESDLRIIHDAVPRRELIIAGDTGTNGEDIASTTWRRIRETFDFAEFRPMLSVEEYMRHYDGRSIAFAPLADTPFNRCKSNLKALEAGAKGLAFVASRVYPYHNEVDKHVVLYASTNAEWRRLFMKLIADPTFRAEQGRALAEHVRRHYHIDRANELRRQVFESLCRV